MIIYIIMLPHKHKWQEVDEIIKENKEEAYNKRHIQSSNKRDIVHTLRAAIVIVDMTKSINMKDFKPSRLSAVTTMLKYYFKEAKSKTSVMKFALGIVEQQSCKIKSEFTYDLNILNTQLDSLKISQECGNFSMASTIQKCLQMFENIPLYFHRQILIIQSSSLTKDVIDIEQKIRHLQLSKIDVNIISLVGFTHIYEVMIKQVKGKYITVNSNEQFKLTINQLAAPPTFNPDSVMLNKVPMSLCKKINSEVERLCLCHFQKCKTFFICGRCEATICKEPPYECPICKIIVIMPIDMHNHLVNI